MLFQCTDTLELSACVQGLEIMTAYCYTLNCKKLLSLTTDFNMTRLMLAESTGAFFS